jgi:hypothetical protein
MCGPGECRREYAHPMESTVSKALLERIAGKGSIEKMRTMRWIEHMQKIA